MSGSKITEKYLLYKLRIKQDPEAFAQLYDLYARRIYRFVYFKVTSHEEAEDITSDVFLKAWHYINEKKTVDSFSGLLYRVARNCIIDLYRSKAFHTKHVSAGTQCIELELGDIGDKGQWAEKIVDNMDAQKVIQGLKKLKEEYREALTLRYVDELSIDEIAEITGKGKIAIRVILHRGLKKLKEILKE